MQTITVKPGQHLLDVAIAATGSIEAVLDMAAAAGISVTDELVPGQDLAAPPVLDGKVVAYYQAGRIEPASN